MLHLLHHQPFHQDIHKYRYQLLCKLLYVHLKQPEPEMGIQVEGAQRKQSRYGLQDG
jgi:hypothetical protein